LGQDLDGMAKFPTKNWMREWGSAMRQGQQVLDVARLNSLQILF